MVHCGKGFAEHPMPAERTDAPVVARTIKTALVILTLLVLTAWALTSYAFPQQWINWCNAVGNQASVAGLFVSLVGFALTIWTLLLTQRIEREARARIERAVSEAQAQAREAVTKIGKHLLTGEAARFRQLVRVIQRAVRGGRCERAARGCEGARHFCVHFRENPHLREEERDRLGRAQNDLRIIAN
jgi:hypothetical protein